MREGESGGGEGVDERGWRKGWVRGGGGGEREGGGC